jgi:hypothetical protein
MERPKLIWAPFVSRGWDFHYHVFDSGPNHGVLFTPPFVENKRRGLDLDYYLTIYYRDYDEITSKSVHRTVEACHGLTVPCNIPGDYVAMSGRSTPPESEFRDMTLADFRHVLDYFSTYLLLLIKFNVHIEPFCYDGPVSWAAAWAAAPIQSLG